MRKLFMVWFLISFIAVSSPGQSAPPSPDKIYGELFREVQMNKVFPDGKTFVDCLPKRKPADIVADYAKLKGAAAFVLKKFVEDNFELPADAGGNATYHTNSAEDVVTHIKHLWSVLRRPADVAVEGSSLLPLPYPYVVPGGRFREVYYWDSYFTMLGLKESGETELMEDMVKNFAYLIDTYGYVPNGNRTYYLGRSQPPFFSLMVELLAGVKGDSIYQRFLPAMEKEYHFWMEGADKIKAGEEYRRVVKVKGGVTLNRYWEDNAVPRPESYREDVLTAERSGRNRVEVYEHLGAGAESGWDFSSRWLADKKTLGTIRTSDLLPVDLNVLLYHLEMTIFRAELIDKQDSAASLYRKKAVQRAEAIDKYFWNKSLGFYTDYDLKRRATVGQISPAGLYPFCFMNEHPDYMSFLGIKVAEVIRKKLLKPGGVLTTEATTGEQWDAPNGWAPLEWITIRGLDRCGQKDLAADIAARWVRMIEKSYKETGKLMEKYNVTDPDAKAGGGEYEGQDGFGWTNGVLLSLIDQYNLPKEWEKKTY